MWLLFRKQYKNSKSATVISAIAMLMRYGGVLALFSGVIPMALVFFGIGIGLHYLAENIASKA